jgi:isopenicillin N synthase-like dioxygenase
MPKRRSKLTIPGQLIDFSRFLTGAAPERISTAQAILHGFQTAGFIYLRNVPISAATLAKTYALSASFFSLPPAAKQSLGWTTPQANRGYSAPGREKVTVLTNRDEIADLRERAPDLKETFEIGREGEPDHPNRWPDEGSEETVAGFRAGMEGFFGECKRLHVEVMRAIAVGMGLDEGFFDGFVDVGDNTLRLLHYPPVEADVFETDAVRAGAHSDYGSITLWVLFGGWPG